MFPTKLVPGKSIELPPRAVTEQYLELYRDSDFASFLPFAEPHMFTEVIEKAYTSSRSSFEGSLPAKACIFSFLALISTMGNPADKTVPPVNVSKCATAAQVLLPDVLTAQASPETVDALMMLVSCVFLSFLQPHLSVVLGTLRCNLLS